MKLKAKLEILVILFLLPALFLTARPKIAMIFNNRAMDYLDEGLYQEAISNLKVALKIEPNTAVYHYNLADIYAEKENFDKAIEEYKKAIQINPNYVACYLALAQIYHLRDMYDKALVYIDMMLRFEPLNQEAKEFLDIVSLEYAADYFNLGLDSFINGNYDEGLNLLKRSIRIKPDFFLAHYSLAYIYFVKEAYNEATKELEKTIKLNQNFWLAHHLLGNIYFEKEQYQKAIDEYKKAKDLSPDDAIVHNDLGLAYNKLEMYDEAINELRLALIIEPSNINIRYSLASSYRDNVMFEEAIKEYKRVISIRPDYPGVHNDLADIYKIRGQDKKAYEEYKREINNCNRALSFNRNDPVALNNLAYAYNGLGEYVKAKEIIEAVLLKQPDFREAHLTSAKIYENLRDYDKALNELEEAKKLHKDINFINRYISWIKKEISKVSLPFCPDVVFLKNGRIIKGWIKEETNKRIVLRVEVGDSQGYITLNRKDIRHIKRDSK